MRACGKEDKTKKRQEKQNPVGNVRFQLYDDLVEKKIGQTGQEM